MPSVSDAVTLDGKLFQMRGAATKNARSPIVERRAMTSYGIGDNVYWSGSHRISAVASSRSPAACLFPTRAVLCGVPQGLVLGPIYTIPAMGARRFFYRWGKTVAWTKARQIFLKLYVAVHEF